jgi:hypothetical protein
MIMKWEGIDVKAHSKFVFQVMTWGDNNKDDEPISNPYIFFLIYDHEVGW